MAYLFLIIVIAIVLAVIAIAAFTNLELDDEHYDRLKWLAIRWSVLVTFLGVLIKTFNFAYGTETVTVVAAIGALMAGLLGISAKNYYAVAEQTSFNCDDFLEMADEWEGEENEEDEEDEEVEDDEDPEDAAKE